MKKWDFILLKGFLYGLPLVVGYAVFAYSVEWQTVGADSGLRTVYDAGGLMLALWMLISVLISVRLVLSTQFREMVLAKLTFIKERDERETYLTGRAAKDTMLTSMAILIFLFCLSCFQVSLHNLPPEQIVDGKTRSISLGVRFELFDTATTKNTNESLLPFSSSSLLLGLFVLQVASYNYSMKRSGMQPFSAIVSASVRIVSPASQKSCYFRRAEFFDTNPLFFFDFAGFFRLHP